MIILLDQNKTDETKNVIENERQKTKLNFAPKFKHAQNCMTAIIAPGIRSCYGMSILSRELLNSIIIIILLSINITEFIHLSLYNLIYYNLAE